MVLDITSIYHDKALTPQEAADCQTTNTKSFVDNNILHTKPKENQSIQHAVSEAISILENYTKANLLSLNPEKSHIMILSKDKNIRDNFQIPGSRKQLTHQPSLMILGNIISDDLTWEEHICKLAIPSLSNRVRTLKNIAPYMDLKFWKNYLNAIFHGKLTFAINVWGGAGKTFLSKVQCLQDRAAKVTLGHPARLKSASQRRQMLGWPSIQEEVNMGTLKLIHKISTTRYWKKC